MKDINSEQLYYKLIKHEELSKASSSSWHICKDHAVKNKRHLTNQIVPYPQNMYSTCCNAEEISSVPGFYH